MTIGDEPALPKDTTPTIKRRGLIAAVWAVVAAVVMKRTTQAVEAGVDGDVVLGTTNVTNANTAVSNGTTLANGSGFTADCLSSPNGFGLQGYGKVTGVGGQSSPGSPGNLTAGVFGAATDLNSFGVWGGQSASNGTAVFGQAVGAGGTGVSGATVSGIGVFGQVYPASSANATAVYGLNYSSYAGPVPGGGGFGVYGLSAKGHGLVGATAAAGAAALVGATNGVVGAYAGAFYGPVAISGALTVFGAKSAAVLHPDGTHRRLYCVESPDSWFEDFGKSQLECGQAVVAIDPDFAAVVAVDDYHVFLTEYGGHSDLSVVEQTPVGFRVEAKDSSSTSRFSWRIVAKRKDIEGPRFETVRVPAEPILPRADVVASQPPRLPEMRPRSR